MILLVLYQCVAQGTIGGKLVHKHTYPAYPYHLRLFEFVVIGGEVKAEHDVMRINFSSPWMLANTLRTLSIWYVTGNFCRASVDLVEFWVNSIHVRTMSFACLSFRTVPRVRKYIN